MARNNVALTLTAPSWMVSEFDKLCEDNRTTRSEWFTAALTKALGERGQWAIVDERGEVTKVNGNKPAIYVTRDRAEEVAGNMNRDVGRKVWSVTEWGNNKTKEPGHAETAGSWNGA